MVFPFFMFASVKTTFNSLIWVKLSGSNELEFVLQAGQGICSFCIALITTQLNDLEMAAIPREGYSWENTVFQE